MHLSLLLQLDHRGYRMETWNVSGLVFYNLCALAKGREMSCFLVVTKNYQLAETDRNCDKVKKPYCHNRTLFRGLICSFIMSDGAVMEVTKCPLCYIWFFFLLWRCLYLYMYIYVYNLLNKMCQRHSSVFCCCCFFVVGIFWWEFSDSQATNMESFSQTVQSICCNK